MTIRLVHDAEDSGDSQDPRQTLAEVAAVAARMRQFLKVCREQPGSVVTLTAADIAQAQAVLAEARQRLARARRRIS